MIRWIIYGGDITQAGSEDYKTIYMPYRNFAERTREEYLNDLEDLVEFLEKTGIENVGKICLAAIERYLAELERLGYAGTTRKRKTVTIRSFLLFLYRDGYVKSNIAKHVIPPFVENKTPKFLTEAESNRLREACSRHTRDRAIIEVLLQTGIRLSELTRLTIDDVNLGLDNPSRQSTDSCLRIRGSRSRKGRIIPLNDKVKEAINIYLSARPDTGSTTLFQNYYGQPYGDRGVQKMLRKYFKEAGIESASVHTLRHTFGVNLVLMGKTPLIIQKAMGNKDSRSISAYLSISEEVKSGGN